MTQTQNTPVPAHDKRLRLAIAGVGNCASSLVQGITYYADADPTLEVPGLMHVVLGGYHINQIDLVAAFDVDIEKVGSDLSKAIGASKNNRIAGRAGRRRSSAA